MNGIRSSKTVNGLKTNYYVSGSTIIAEERLNANGGVETFIYYIYDASGIAGFFVNDSYYYFTKNLFGDIIGIKNEANELVASYTYNAWGECTIGTNVDGIANLNPFRYRGYYYDTETGFYYLQTRYYDPDICRFISADDLEILGDLASVVGQLNLYAYCGNNPIMFVDPTGTEWWHWALGAVVVISLAVLTRVTAGGFAAGMSALMFASYGLATASTATSILAFATVAAGTTLAASAVVAGIDSATVFYSGGNLKDASDVFMQQGEGALYATFSAGLVGAFNGYVANSVYRSLHIQGTSKAKQYEKPYTVYTKISQSG